MRSVKYGSLIAAMVVAMSGVIFGAAQPASAKPVCDSGWYCIYADAGWGGKECSWPSNVSTYTGFCADSFGGSANDIASAWINSGTGTYQYIHSYEHANYVTQLWVSLGYNQSDCSWVGNVNNECGGTGASAFDNDKASSHSWGSS